MPHLGEEDVRKLMAAIEKTVGSSKGVEVSAPTKGLEEFFLQVVEDARRERLQTAGAEAGTAAASFLMGEETGGEELVEELVKAARETGVAATEAEPQPLAAPSADEGVIRDLVSGPKEDGKGARQDESGTPPAGAEPRVRRDVLDELIADDADGGERDEG
jgi:hypothetical protein